MRNRPGSPVSRRPPPAAAGRITGDLWGGVAAMLVALPAGLAYGIAVYSRFGDDGLAPGVHAGIVGTVVLGMVAAAVGGAPRLISAPCAPAAALLAAFAAQLPAAEAPSRAMAFVTLLALLTGALQAGFGALRAGRLIKYIPYPVVSGYLSAVGVIIIVTQLPNLVGAPRAGPPWGWLLAPGGWQWPGIIVGACSFAAMYAARRAARPLPGPILGLLAGVAAYFVCAAFLPGMRQPEGNPLLLGPVAADGGRLWSTIRETWASLASFSASDWRVVLFPALTLAVLLSVDTLKTCVVVDALARDRHDSNRTLVGQGVGNVAAAVFGGMPGAGTVGATLVSVESGGRTPAAGMIAAATALVAALVFGRWLAWVPVPALAGMLIFVGARMVDRASFTLARQKATLLDFSVVLTVIVVAVAFNLIAAAGAGVALAILLFIRDQIRASVIRRKSDGSSRSSTQHRLPAERAVLDRHAPGTVICELQGNLFFGTTDQLEAELEADLERCRHLILDLRRVQSIDYTAAHLFTRLEATLAARDGWLLFSRMPARPDFRAYLTQVGLFGPGRRVRQFATLDDALRWAEDEILGEHLPQRTPGEKPLALGEFELLRDESVSALAALGHAAVERSFAAGETIFKGGETASDHLFMIRRGVVRIALPLANGQYHNLASFGRGDFFGEMSFLDRGFRSAHAIATTDADLYLLSRARFDAISREQPEIGAKMFARLAQTLAIRLRHTNAQLRALYDN